jgi:epoxyqueuosine reductase
VTPGSHDSLNNGFTARLRAQAEALGFVAFGVARADAAPESAARLREWLDSGAHGDMIWMEERAEQRGSPAALWPEVRSVVMLGMSYAPAEDPMRLAGEAGIGRISVYAQGQDYHDIVKKALKALARWIVAEAGAGVKVFVDTAPVMEKPLAAAAGLGWQGKHSNLVSHDHGSWLLLGAIMTTLEVGADIAGDTAHPVRCGSCEACLKACPTDAFTAPFRIDARRCISYLTIENKGPIPVEFRTAIGNRIYGCDDCLAVCPWNKFAASAHANRAFAARAELAVPELADLLALDDAGFRQVFAGSPIKRIGRDRMVRNALIAAGNSGRPQLVGQVVALLDDSAAVVRGAAVWALARLDPADWASRRAGRIGVETDPAVLAEWHVAPDDRPAGASDVVSAAVSGDGFSAPPPGG